MSLKRVALLLVVLAGLTGRAEATCSGSGVAYTCTTGSTASQVQSVLNSAANNAVITFNSGTYNWSGGEVDFDPTKGATLICGVASYGCALTLGGASLGMVGIGVGTMTNLYRISGFELLGACTDCIWFYPASGQGTPGPVWQKIRIDHNWFHNIADDSDVLLFGEGSRPAQFWGSIDNNLFTYNHQTRFVSYGMASPPSWNENLMGSAHCMVWEDNDIEFANPDNGGAGFADSENSACTIYRFNKIVNTRLLVHGVTHGWGSSNFEAYGNAFITDKNTADGLSNCYRRIHNQGSGTGAFWGNTFSCFTAITGDVMALLHYRDTTATDALGGGTFNDGQGRCDGTQSVDGNTAPTATYRGYPCKNQPGRTYTTGAPAWGFLAPIPVFNNKASSTKLDLEFDCPWVAGNFCANHVIEGRDFYNGVNVNAQTSATSPFNGTAGIGFGTLANRPTSCTHTTAPDGDEGGGVMYWATDQGSWNTSSTNPFGVQQSGADGVLYRCSSTNTWTTYYTPYQYPHALQGGAAPSTDAPKTNPSRSRFLRRGLDALMVMVLGAASAALKMVR